LETIQQFLTSNGINESDLTLDGTFKELKTASGFKGWYVGDDLGEGKRSITIEDWRTRDRKSFVEGVDLTDPNERAKLEEIRLRYEKEKLDLQLLKKKFSQKKITEFTSSSWNTPSEYLTKKKITETFGAILVESRVEVTDLVIPMHDKNNVVWNYQTIQDSGAKSFVPGALVDGLYFMLKGSGPENPDEIVICEGFATACSVKMATSAVVVCAFSANNLQLAAENVREIFPSAKILIAGDDDWKKEPNAGAQKAEEAAKAVCGNFVLPIFPKVRGANDTDWNDLHQRYDLDLIQKQIGYGMAATSPPSAIWSKSFTEARRLEAKPTKTAQKAASAHKRNASALNSIDSYINGVVPMNCGVTKTGQPILPHEFEAANELFKYYDGRCVVSEESVFIYDQTHWKEVDQFNEGKIMVQIQVLYGGSATNSKLKSTYEQFKNLLPKSGRNLYEPTPHVVNFQNGTMHIERKDDKWDFRFAPHSKLDFCTHVIPIEFDTTRSVRNEAFEAMINRICGVDDDGIEKVRAVKQMYGACVAPIFPHLFMLHGPAKSGKTSLIIPAQRLVDRDNWSSVEPHEFKGFTMESMAGKLVNIVTDIDLSQPINDNHIKKIEDRVPIRIDRKFKNAVLAPLPAVHIFGGNDIPPTFEKGSGAHERRWTFIQIEGLKVTGNYSKSFANDTFEKCPQGVLNWALEGLHDVLESNGHYFVPKSGKEKMEAWQTQHDPVAQFIKEINEGEVREFTFSPESRVKRSSIWPVFVKWYLESYNKNARISKSKFFEAFCKCPGSPNLVQMKISAGERYFVGLRDTGEVTQSENKGSPN